jgi:MoaA/NifB/PqqE/SkfB family radical SAM enzyme
MKLPWKATLCLTYLCNLRCGFCRIWERRPKNELTLEEWTRILTRSPRLLWIDLTGGEPTVRSDFGDILESCAAIARPWLLHFPTNGSFPERLRGLKKRTRRARLVATVSIDGPRAVHDRMRGVEGSFDRCVESIRVLREEGVTVAAGMTVTAENESTAAELLSDLERLVPGFTERDLHVNLAQVSEHYYGNTREMFREALDVPRIGQSLWPPATVLQSWLERRYRRLMPAFLETRRTPIPCRSLQSSVFVSPMGLVHPCITDSRVVGDLRACDYDLSGLLESEEAGRLRNEIASGRCPHCWTPCEAYPTIIESVPGAGAALRFLR